MSDSRFRLTLNFSYLAKSVTVENPALLTDQLLDQAWNTLSDFVIDMLDDLGIEITDELFREIFIETCYRLVYREMTTLYYLPIWDEGFKERLGTRKTGARVKRESPYREVRDE